VEGCQCIAEVPSEFHGSDGVIPPMRQPSGRVQPFGVIAPDLALPHHQDPITKALCLLGTDTERWRPSLTVAHLLNEQVPKLLTISEPGYQTGTVTPKVARRVDSSQE
jgi:hypothetical protein